MVPIPSPTVTNSREVKRQVFCRSYETCLDYAIQKNWEGFSCERCRCYKAKRLDMAEWHEDYNSCMALVYFVSFSRLKLQVCSTNQSFQVRGRKKKGSRR